MPEIGKLELVASMLGRDVSTVKRTGATAFGERSDAAHELLLSAEAMKSAAPGA